MYQTCLMGGGRKPPCVLPAALAAPTRPRVSGMAALAAMRRHLGRLRGSFMGSRLTAVIERPVTTACPAQRPEENDPGGKPERGAGREPGKAGRWRPSKRTS